MEKDKIRKPWEHCKKEVLSMKAVNAFKDTLSINESDAASNVDTKKQIKYGTKTQAAWGIFSEYCDNSTIQRAKATDSRTKAYTNVPQPFILYICNVCAFQSSIFQKDEDVLIKTILDLCICLVDIHLYFLNDEHLKQMVPFLSFAEKSTAVWDIPFPTVTICPESKSRPEIFNFSDVSYRLEYYLNVTEQEKYYMEAGAHVCITHLMEFEDFGNELANASDLVAAIMRTSIIFGKTVTKCKWRNKDFDCKDRMHEIITEEGLCFSFNSFTSKTINREEAHETFLRDEIAIQDESDQHIKWNLETGYKKKATSNSYPYRVLSSGAGAGLVFLLRGVYQENDLYCRGAVHGFKILLTTPGEVPQVSEQYFTVPFNQMVLIAIKPEVITTSEGLRHYEPERRQCYFQKERYLRYYKSYTQNNCKLECLANYTMKRCGCVKFSMPRDANSPVCGAGKVQCMRRAKENLAFIQFKQSSSKTYYRNVTDCNCFPACFSISYEAEISQVDYEYVKFYQPYDNNTRFSKVSIFFKHAQFLTSKRSELYGITDFIANCGGLLGLFMGVSTLSIVELVYFFTVRLVSNLKMRRRKRLELERSQNANGDNAEMGINLTQKQA